MNCHDDDFTFTVGDEQYRCPCFVAEFLSPRISQLRSSDPTLREFRVNTADPNKDFEQCLSLGQGHEVSLLEAKADFYFEIALQLWNQELFDLICDLHGCPDNKVVGRLSIASQVGVDCESLIGDCRSSFTNLSSSVLSKLNIELLSSILSDQKMLHITSEDDLYKFIKTQMARDFQYSALFKFIHFE
jgi:hypothetical protein